ncbi:MAG: 2-oxo-4-hydroxy-4-carboxy-5-ureidoimidazoline decarboxylase [Verrucomicrobiae bacterium]|nr:2-oxo-4-hydroxy-4-carboxy-5-ureidoimidazoline decarboxylase [Verrucomicrobiae bacterium]
MTLSEINQLSQSEFTKIFGGVFEHSPWIAEEGWKFQPFSSGSELHQKLCKIVTQSSEKKQLALLNAHPDLVGKIALEGKLTQASTQEQTSAGLTQLSTEEIQLFQNNNRAYREKFGFPFIICARLNKKEAILNGFKNRLQNSREQEMKTALEEIYKIAEFRLRDLITDKF